MEDNTAWECIRTIAATDGCKIYSYTNAMRTCTCTMRTANDTPRIPVHAAQKTVDSRAEVFLHQSKQHMFQNQNNNKKYCVSMKITPLIGRCIRIGRRLHVNQPLQLGVERCGSVFVLSADIF